MIETLHRVPVDVPPAKPRPKKLTLLRRFWRRSRRYLLMGVMAFTLSFGLVAVPVVKAEADLLSAATIAEINGAMRMPLTQVVVGAIRTHPVGFALVGVGALALYAYSEKDQWMPYVTGLFGQPDADQPAPTEGGYRSLTGFQLTHFEPALPNRMAIGYSYQGSTSSKTYTISTNFDCRQITYVQGGRPVGEVFKNVTTFTGGVSGQGLTGPATIGKTGAGRVCPDNSEIISGTMGPDTVNPNGPQNILTYGDIGGFDPRGEGTNYVVSAECIDSAGNISVVEYTSRGTDGMLRMPPCAELSPGSHGTGKMWIDGYAPGSTVPQRLYDVDPMNDPDHPLCSPTRPGSGCTLGVSIDGKPCIVGDVQCENWTEIRRDDQTGARVSCNYGPYLVGVDKCNILERAYQIGGAPATEENMDGNPETSNFQQPNGDPWKPSPQPKPGTGTNTSTLPTTGVNPGSNPGEDGQNCLSQGWSWNPVSWVMVPTQCALQWAFVPPKLKVETALQTLQPRLEARGITPFVTPFMASLGNLGGSGCAGPPIDLSVVHLPTFYPFSACADPMDKIASGVSSFFALSLVVQGGMSCIRGVAAAFGFNWGLGSSRTEDGS